MAEHRDASKVLDEHFHNHTAPSADEIDRERRARDAVAEARAVFLQNFREELESFRSKGVV